MNEYTTSKLRQMRHELKLTQIELAEKLGVCEKTIENHENNRHKKSRIYAYALIALQLLEKKQKKNLTSRKKCGIKKQRKAIKPSE